MPKPPVTKPRTLPKGFGWDPDRRQVTLRFMAGGKQRTVRGDNVAECRTKRDDFIARIEGSVELPNGERTVAQLLDAWYAFHAAKRKPKTRETYRRSIGLVAAHPLAQRVASAVLIGDVENFYVWMVNERDLGQSQLWQTRTHLHMAFKHGMKHGFNTVNPVIGADFPAGVRPPREATFLYEDEFHLVRRHLTDNPTPVNLALLTGLLTGLRPGEVAGLCWDAVDLDAGVLEVRRELQMVGEDGHRRFEVVDDLKNPQSHRFVELTPDLIAALRHELDARRFRARSPRGWRENNLCFTVTGRPLDHNRLAYHLRKALRVLGLEHVSPHKLRHTNGSILLNSGEFTLADVARHLGHKNLVQVTTRYAHSVKRTLPVAAALARIV
jgi:integrase